MGALALLRVLLTLTLLCGALESPDLCIFFAARGPRLKHALSGAAMHCVLRRALLAALLCALLLGRTAGSATAAPENGGTQAAPTPPTAGCAAGECASPQASPQQPQDGQQQHQLGAAPGGGGVVEAAAEAGQPAGSGAGPASGSARGAEQPLQQTAAASESQEGARPAGTAPVEGEAEPAAPAEKEAPPAPPPPEQPPEPEPLPDELRNYALIKDGEQAHSAAETRSLRQPVRGSAASVWKSGVVPAQRGRQAGGRRPPPAQPQPAAPAAGAKVVQANKEAKKLAALLDADSDTYVKNDCKADKWYIIELSQLARVSRVELWQVRAAGWVHRRAQAGRRAGRRGQAGRRAGAGLAGDALHCSEAGHVVLHTNAHRPHESLSCRPPAASPTRLPARSTSCTRRGCAPLRYAAGSRTRVWTAWSSAAGSTPPSGGSWAT